MNCPDCKGYHSPGEPCFAPIGQGTRPWFKEVLDSTAEEVKRWPDWMQQNPGPAEPRRFVSTLPFNDGKSMTVETLALDPEIRQSFKDLSNQVSTWVVNTKDEHIREALVSLGWTPPAKGNKGAECNRTCCKNPRANWFNSSTCRYYCGHCAQLIMQWPENFGLLTEERL